MFCYWSSTRALGRQSCEWTISHLAGATVSLGLGRLNCGDSFQSHQHLMFMGYGHWLPTPSFSERCLDAPAFSDDFTDFKQLSCFGMSEKKVLERDESLVLLAGGWRQVEVFQSNAVFFVSSSSSSTSSPSIHTGGIGFQHLHLVKGVLTLQHSVTTSLTSNNSPALAWVKRKCWSVMSHIYIIILGSSIPCYPNMVNFTSIFLVFNAPVEQQTSSVPLNSMVAGWWWWSVSPLRQCRWENSPTVDDLMRSQVFGHKNQGLWMFAWGWFSLAFQCISYPPENVARMHVLGLIPLNYLKYDRGYA